MLKEIRREYKDAMQSQETDNNIHLTGEARRGILALGLGTVAFFGAWASHSKIGAPAETALLNFSTLSTVYAGIKIGKFARSNLSAPKPVSDFLSNRRDGAQVVARRAQHYTARGYHAITSLGVH